MIPCKSQLIQSVLQSILRLMSTQCSCSSCSEIGQCFPSKMSHHWENGPWRNTQIPGTCYFEVHCCFIKLTSYTSVQNINSKSDTPAVYTYTLYPILSLLHLYASTSIFKNQWDSHLLRPATHKEGSCQYPIGNNLY